MRPWGFLLEACPREPRSVTLSAADVGVTGGHPHGRWRAGRPWERHGSPVVRAELNMTVPDRRASDPRTVLEFNEGHFKVSIKNGFPPRFGG